MKNPPDCQSAMNLGQCVARNGHNILIFPFILFRAANYCRTSDNVQLNLANVRGEGIMIGHWSDHKKNCHIIHFFAVTKSDCKFAFCNKAF